MKAEIISIGTEILLGEIIDTNANFIASQLPLLGIDLYYISAVGDNQKRLVNTLKHAWQRSKLIICTGGLGPTQDDITREAIAEFLREDITVDSAIVHQLQEFFHNRKLNMPPSNIKQASKISSAQIIPNPRGTAPGWWIERYDHIIIAMPGPPQEMQSMWLKEIYSKLKQVTENSVILSRILKTMCLSEAEVDETVSPFLACNNPTLATYSKTDGIYLRITAKSQQRTEAEKLIAQRESDIRALLEEYIWGTDSDTLENIIGILLIKKGLNIGIIESNTEGIFANLFSQVPESHKFFKGGGLINSKDNEFTLGMDTEFLSPNKTTSAEVADTMATIARKKLGANIGIGITGSTEEIRNKAIYLSIDDSNTIHRIVRNYSCYNSQIQQRAINSILFELRKILIFGGNHASHN